MLAPWAIYGEASHDGGNAAVLAQDRGRELNSSSADTMGAGKVPRASRSSWTSSKIVGPFRKKPRSDKIMPDIGMFQLAPQLALSCRQILGVAQTPPDNAPRPAELSQPAVIFCSGCVCFVGLRAWRSQKSWRTGHQGRSQSRNPSLTAILTTAPVANT